MTAAVIKPVYDNLMGLINEIDEQLDASDDSAGASKRRIKNELVTKFDADSSTAFNSFSTELGALSEDDLVGIYAGFMQKMEKEWGSKVNAILEARVAAQPQTEKVEISPEQLAELSKQRSELYQQIKMAVQLANSTEPGGVDWAMPKTRRGSKGKRGPRAMNLMVWAVNGEELDPQPEKIKDLAEVLGFVDTTDDKGETVSAQRNFTAYLKSKDVNTTNPENGEIRVELPNGQELYGYIPETDEDEDEIPDED